MSVTPESWLKELFEYEFCAECGGDAEDHEVCLVPGFGTFFARCLRPDLTEDDENQTYTGDRS